MLNIEMMKLAMKSSLYSKLFFDVGDRAIEDPIIIEPIHGLDAIQDELPINNFLRLHLI